MLMLRKLQRVFAFLCFIPNFADRLQNLWIEAGNTRSRHGNGSLVNGNLCFYHKPGNKIAGGETKAFTCYKYTTGRYISVAIIPVFDENILTLCEVEVYGKEMASKGCKISDTTQLPTPTSTGQFGISVNNRDLSTVISTIPAASLTSTTPLLVSAELSTRSSDTEDHLTSTTPLLVSAELSTRSSDTEDHLTSTTPLLVSAELSTRSSDTEDYLTSTTPLLVSAELSTRSSDTEDHLTSTTPLSVSAELSTRSSDTEDYLTPSISTSHMETVTTTNLLNCFCVCNKTSELYDGDKLVEFIEALKKELKVDKERTSMHIRKLTSAPDDRSSSKTIGIAGVLMLILAFAVPIVFDMITLVKHMLH